MTELQKLERSLSKKGHIVCWYGHYADDTGNILFYRYMYSPRRDPRIVEFEVTVGGPMIRVRKSFGPDDDPVQALQDAVFELGLELAWVS